MAGQGIRREQRLRRQSDFQALRERGLSRAHPLAVLRAAPNALPYVRLGFVVGRRVSRLAVARNRTRRRLREIARSLPLREGWDLLFIARRSALEASFSELRDVIGSLAGRLDLLTVERHRTPASQPAGSAE